MARGEKNRCARGLAIDDRVGGAGVSAVDELNGPLQQLSCGVIPDIGCGGRRERRRVCRARRVVRVVELL